MLTHLADVQDFRTQAEAERTTPVRVSPYIKVDYTELPGIPDMSLQFIVGGGVFLTFDYRIVGGPDDGKRITLVPWNPKHSLTSVITHYNGTPEEAEAAYGYTSRPALQFHGTLHIATIMFLRGQMQAEREYKMANELSRLYDRLYEERAAEQAKEDAA
jgi:hypothetical protein